MVERALGYESIVFRKSPNYVSTPQSYISLLLLVLIRIIHGQTTAVQMNVLHTFEGNRGTFGAGHQTSCFVHLVYHHHSCQQIYYAS